MKKQQNPISRNGSYFEIRIAGKQPVINITGGVAGCVAKYLELTKDHSQTNRDRALQLANQADKAYKRELAQVTTIKTTYPRYPGAEFRVESRR